MSFISHDGYYTRIFELTSMKIQPRVQSVFSPLNAFKDVYIFFRMSLY